MTDDNLRRAHAALAFLDKNWETPLVDNGQAARLLRARPGTLRMRIWRGVLEVCREPNGAPAGFTGQQLTYALVSDRVLRWGIELTSESALQSIDTLCDQIRENILEEPHHFDACAYFMRSIGADNEKTIEMHVCPEGFLPPHHFIETALVVPIGRLVLRLAHETQVYCATRDQQGMDAITRLH